MTRARWYVALYQSILTTYSPVPLGPVHIVPTELGLSIFRTAKCLFICRSSVNGALGSSWVVNNRVTYCYCDQD